MAKRYEEVIEVLVVPAPAHPDSAGDPAGAISPAAFSWRGRRYEVDQHLGTWREAGEWWDGKRARDREYHRVLARPAGALATGDLDADGFMHTVSAVFDVYRDRVNGCWRLARLWD